MAISHVNSQADSTANGTSVTITKPTGTTTGDLLIAVFTSNYQNCTPPAGWSDLVDVGIEVFRTQAFYKVAGGSEPASYTFSVPNNAPLVGRVSCLRGADPSDPIDINPSTHASFAESEGHSTPGVTGGSSGRLLYFRAVRYPGTTVPTFTAAGVTEISDAGIFSGGSVCYGGALYLANSDYSTGGGKSGLSITSSQSESHNTCFTVGVRAAGTPGTMDFELLVPTMDASGSLAYPAVMDVDLPLPSVETDVFYGEYEGPLDVQVPIDVSVSGWTEPRGPLSVVVDLSFDAVGETRRFAENVVAVQREERWLIITQDHYRLGRRQVVYLPMRVELPLIGVGFSGLVTMQINMATVVANKPTARVRVSAGTATATVAANGVTKRDGDIGFSGLAAVSVAASGASVRVGPRAGQAAATVTAFDAKGVQAPAGAAAVSVTASGATAVKGVLVNAGYASVTCHN
ncbi:hypothetical protein [Streptomyces sp. S1]|uniref:hypothetical protein n=1 Tax=Streptomyces sp. S1 TaxID=718288 RepID=UPI003D7126BD